MNITLARNLKGWSAKEDKEFIDTVEAYLKGDHYQDGQGWIGPEVGEKGIDYLRRIMINEGVFATALKRIVLAVVGSEPYFYVTDKKTEEAQQILADMENQKGTENQDPKTATVPPQIDKNAQGNNPVDPTSQTTPPLDPSITLNKIKTVSKNQELIDEAEDLLTKYWDRHNVHKHLIQIAYDLAAKNRAVGRLVLPADVNDVEEDFDLQDFEATYKERASKLADDRIVSVVFKDLEDAILNIIVQKLDIFESGYVRDEVDRIVGTVYKYVSPITNKAEWEVSYVSKASETYNQTCVEILNENGASLAKNHYSMDKQLMLCEVEGGNIVRPDIITHLRAADHTSTMMVMNNTFAGFRERLFLNAEVPTKTVRLPGGGTEEVETELNEGPGTDLFLAGVPVEDPVTKEIRGYATPTAIYKDPVNQEGLIKSIFHHIQRILENMSQGHILISGDATTSGVSRVQAVQDHIASLKMIEQSVTIYTRWLLESLLHFSADLMKQPDRYADLRVVVKCRLSAVLPTPEERKAVVEEYNAGLRSRENSRTNIGIDDPAAEEAQVLKEEIQDLDTGRKPIPAGQMIDQNNPGRTIPDPAQQDPNAKKPTSPGNF